MNSKKIYNKLQQRMPDFQLGKVYKLTNEIDDKVYVGSTCQSLSRRLRGHKYDAKRSPNSPVYVHINKIGWDKVEIVLIENYPCNSEKELKFREKFYQELLKSELNTLSPILSEDERKQKDADRCRIYRQNNVEKLKEMNKKKYERNKGKILEEMKKYYQDNAEKIKQKNITYYHDNKEKSNERCKKYRLDNKESLKAASKKYRLDNREKLIQLERIKYQNNKVNCICGGSYNGSKPSMKDRHENTERHNKYVKSNIHTLFWDKRNEILM